MSPIQFVEAHDEVLKHIFQTFSIAKNLFEFHVQDYPKENYSNTLSMFVQHLKIKDLSIRLRDRFIC